MRARLGSSNSPLHQQSKKAEPNYPHIARSQEAGHQLGILRRLPLDP